MRKSTGKNDTRPYGRGTGVPNPIDVHVGKRIRMRRLFLGMNQESLANALGVTFQQVQKYEGGANRVSASRLAAMAQVLDVPIPYFFANLGDGSETTADSASQERMERAETIDLLRFYYGISDETIRQRFRELLKAIAAQQST